MEVIENTLPKPKSVKKLSAPKKTAAPKKAPVAAAKAAPQPKARTAAKPVAAYNFVASYDGTSGPLNARASRTSVDFSKFGSLANAALSDRDQKTINDLRREFGAKPFIRQNIDAGILRRLGERGVLEHVAGSDVDPQASFKLTKKGLGK